jgi:hypothetical protein
VSLAYIILGRDAGLVIAAFYYRYISLPKPVSYFYKREYLFVNVVDSKLNITQENISSIF